MKLPFPFHYSPSSQGTELIKKIKNLLFSKNLASIQCGLVKEEGGEVENYLQMYKQ